MDNNQMCQKMCGLGYSPDKIMNLKELAQALSLDPRSVRRIALELGGRRIGTCWRFRWGEIMEYFSDAYFEKRSRQCVAGEGDCTRQNGGHEILSRRSPQRARMDGRKKMGDRKKKGISCGIGEEADAHGLRAAYELGR